MRTCHICNNPWTSHAPDCRVSGDLERMRRVYDRLVAEDREPALKERIGGYLGLFGGLPCQLRDGLPSGHDCDACGHKDICVIVPQAA